MEKIATDNKKLSLVGDFNIDLLKLDLDPLTTNFFDVITINLLVPLNCLNTSKTELILFKHPNKKAK